MRTSYQNWNLENWIWTLAMSAFIVLPTMSCGLALWVQAGEMKARRAEIVETCNAQAAARSADGGALPGVGAASGGEDLSRYVFELRPELQPSRVARQAFLACVDNRGT